MLTFRKLTALLSCASLAFGATAASATDYPCFYSDEQQSARIHDFQVLMMVSALKCQDLAPGSVSRYGAMLAQRDRELAEHGDRLLARMIDERGYREGRRAFDTYETTLSNAYSERQLTPEICHDLGAYARMALEANPAELETLARLASRRAITMCEAGAARTIIDRRSGAGDYPGVRVFRGAVPPQVAAAAASRAASPEPQAAPAPASEFPAMVSAPVTEPVIDDAALATAQAASAAAASATSAAEARVAEVEETEPPAPPSDRLDAAIKALDNAAQALRGLRDEQAPSD